jgi:oxygen-independent coproporphyrinogen-3 oxidase
MFMTNSVYLHVPFCESKCPYCAFASAVKNEGDEKIYLDALARETAVRVSSARLVDTLYIGGGTPSALSVPSWNELIALLEKFFVFSAGAEISVEANPNSLSDEHLRLWKNWRVSRVSIGVQSFSGERLAFLGRIHDARQARRAVTTCLDAGFSVSLDLMFGLPGESARDWGLDLRTAIGLNPHHISVYQLTAEPGTPFGQKHFSQDDGYAQYRYAQWRLQRAGYEQYEVASFAVPAHESRHNLNYWDDGEYLGLGPSAWSCLNGERFQNEPSLENYADTMARGYDAPVRERLDAEAAARLSAVLALRTNRGIVWEKFKKKHGPVYAGLLSGELSKFPPGLVLSAPDRTFLTPKGLRLGNSIWSAII